MGRKKKSFHKSSIQIETGNDRYDNQAGRIKAINTLDDIEYDSEDEYYESRGEILINDDYNLRQDETESSEEEVFTLRTSGTLSDEEDEEDREHDLISSDDNDFDSQTWGNHKKNYYDADELSDIGEAKEEEEEALRLQKERISKMSEEDFYDDNLFRFGSVSTMDMDKENEKKFMERLNQEIQKTSFESKEKKSPNKIKPGIFNQDHSDLSRSEVIEKLQDASPELVELINEFKEKLSILKDILTPIMEKLEKAKKRNIKYNPAIKFLSIKYHILLNYLTNISFYFFLKSSGTHHLRTHPVINALVDLRTTLDKLEILESKMEDVIREFINRLETDERIDQNEKADRDVKVDGIINKLPSQILIDETKKSEKNESLESKNRKKSNKEKKVQESKKTNEESEESDNDNLLNITAEPEFVSLMNMKKNKRKRDSDFGDLDVLNDVDADDKAQKRKSLRHYVANVNQTIVNREKAIHLGGDTDIPYKDNDRSAINPAKNLNNGDNLDDLDWNEDDEKAANDIENGNEDDEFYLAVQKTRKAKKEQKKLEYEQLVKSNKVVYEEEILPDGSKRQIDYQILKNKGLTPHRKKDQRNPRVKHRNKYEKAKKKIKSFKRAVIQQEGPYDGEKTGIKTKLSRSIKFGN